MTVPNLKSGFQCEHEARWDTLQGWIREEGRSYHASHQSVECESRKPRTVNSGTNRIDKRNSVYSKEPYLKWVYVFNSYQAINRFIINGDKNPKLFTAIEEFVNMFARALFEKDCCSLQFIFTD